MPGASSVRLHDDRRGSRADQLLAVALKLIYRKARCMDRAPVLGDEVSIRVEELLIIGAVEAIAIVADGIQLPELEPYALWVTRDTAGCPSPVE